MRVLHVIAGMVVALAPSLAEAVVFNLDMHAAGQEQIAAWEGISKLLFANPLAVSVPSATLSTNKSTGRRT